MTHYLLSFEFGIGVPRLETHCNFSSDSSVIEYTKRVAKEFASCDRFVCVWLWAEPNGDQRLVACVALRPAAAEPYLKEI